MRRERNSLVQRNRFEGAGCKLHNLACCLGCDIVPPSAIIAMIFSAFASVARKLIPPRFRPIGYLENLVRARTDGRIWSGPFSGMRWTVEGRGRSQPTTTQNLTLYNASIH